MSSMRTGRRSARSWAGRIFRGYSMACCRATTSVTLEPRLAGQAVLLFGLDSNLRVDAILDTQGETLPFFQARETKDRYQSYGDYVAVVLASPFPVGQSQTLEFRYAGKRAI